MHEMTTISSSGTKDSRQQDPSKKSPSKTKNKNIQRQSPKTNAQNNFQENRNNLSRRIPNKDVNFEARFRSATAYLIGIHKIQDDGKARESASKRPTTTPPILRSSFSCHRWSRECANHIEGIDYRETIRWENLSHFVKYRNQMLFVNHG